MKKQKKRSFQKKMSTKEIAILTECSIRTAERIKKDIKYTFGVDVVQKRHYNLYFLI